MPTSRPLVEGDVVVAINLPLNIGDLYYFNYFNPRRHIPPEHFVLASDFDLLPYTSNSWWERVGERIFGIAGASTADPRLLSAIRRGTAPALYVREGDTVEPWSSYQAVTPAKQKHFDALAELQASFRAAKAAAKTTVQPVLTRFDLLEGVVVVVKMVARRRDDDGDE